MCVFEHILFIVISLSKIMPLSVHVRDVRPNPIQMCIITTENENISFG